MQAQSRERANFSSNSSILRAHSSIELNQRSISDDRELL